MPAPLEFTKNTLFHAKHIPMKKQKNSNGVTRVTKKRKTGDFGEGLACMFLVKRGFVVVERNYWKPWGEIDVIARKGRSLRFVEVKTGTVTHETGNIVSRETYLGDFRPEEHVTHEKLAKLNRAIQTYLVERRVSPKIAYQIDVISVRMNLKDRTAKVDFIENVF